MPEIATPLKPLIVANKTVYCLGDTITLNADAISGYTYTWTLPGGDVINGTNQVMVPVDSLYKNGTYTLIAKNDICVSQVSSITPVVGIKPKAVFSITPAIGHVLYIPAEVNFTNKSINGDTYLWDFGDGSTSNEATPKHVYTTGGKYSVKLTAYNATGCLDDVTQGELIIKNGNTILIPNTFTPNGDGFNDKFDVAISYTAKYEIRVFNRAGSLIFQSRDLLTAWEGTYNGRPVPAGTYYYIINATGLDGNIIKQSGPVTVLR